MCGFGSFSYFLYITCILCLFLNEWVNGSVVYTMGGVSLWNFISLAWYDCDYDVLSILLGYDVSIIRNVLFRWISVTYPCLWLAYSYCLCCVVVVCAMIVWRVCYTGANDIADGFGVEYTNERKGWTHDLCSFLLSC